MSTPKRTREFGNDESGPLTAADCIDLAQSSPIPPDPGRPRTGSLADQWTPRLLDFLDPRRVGAALRPAYRRAVCPERILVRAPDRMTGGGRIAIRPKKSRPAGVFREAKPGTATIATAPRDAYFPKRYKNKDLRFPEAGSSP